MDPKKLCICGVRAPWGRVPRGLTRPHFASVIGILSLNVSQNSYNTTWKNRIRGNFALQKNSVMGEPLYNLLSLLKLLSLTFHDLAKLVCVQQMENPNFFLEFGLTLFIPIKMIFFMSFLVAV